MKVPVLFPKIFDHPFTYKSEMSEKLNSGDIDAAEWFGPWNDSYLKLYEAAKYYYYPGMHEPSSMLSLGIFSAFALLIAVLSALLVSGSGPPDLAAMVIDLASLGKTLDILSQRFSFDARRYSNALPIISKKCSYFSITQVTDLKDR